MAPETQENGSTSETEAQEQEEQQSTTPETGGNGSSQEPSTVEINDSTQLPESHPLVKTLAKQKQDLAAHKTELAEARAQAKRVTELEAERDARPTKEALETLQTRYDRLEAFLLAAGGDLGKALDSRTFTRDLFESDKDIATLVKDWQKAHPSATSKALGNDGSGGSGNSKPDMNELLRAAIKQ
ncbi:scaffolding protein [Microbacterium phage ChickenKing]|nr:scaffolding protein [Microbacterium phage ChickenKing]